MSDGVSLQVGSEASGVLSRATRSARISAARSLASLARARNCAICGVPRGAPACTTATASPGFPSWATLGLSAVALWRIARFGLGLAEGPGFVWLWYTFDSFYKLNVQNQANPENGPANP